jgi:site-specific DNA-methyltransferase (adenine-specific)
MNTVHLIDCMEFMKDVPDKYYSLSIVDPPYGIGMAREFSIDTKNGVRKRPPMITKEWDCSIPDEKYFTELFRISRNQIIWGMNYFIKYLQPSSNFLIWDKCNHLPTFADCEIAWCNIKYPSKIFRLDNKGWNSNEDCKIHPTQKPVALYKWLLQNYAKPHDKIFDSHVGSGSSRIACYDLGFDFEGCELDADYHKAQEERYQSHIKQQSLFDTAEIQSLIYKDVK